MAQRRRLVAVANTDWYLFNFRQALLKAAVESGLAVQCISPPGPFGSKLGEIGVSWESLPFARESRFGMIGSIPRVLLWLRRQFHSEKPALVHSFTLTSILFTWLGLPRSAGVVRVNAVTGLGYAFTGDSWKHRVLRVILKPLLNRALGHPAAWTVVQNDTDRQFLTKTFGLRATRVRLIPGSGVDVERFSPVRVRAAGEPFTVGFVGRLLTDKGVREFVEAARQVRARFPDVRFMAAGVPDAGNPATVDALQLAEWRAAGAVEFVGQVDDMPVFLNGLDLFVLPSYREGLSRSLIEAGACGLPAVTTDVPGCRDVVIQGKNGLVVPPRNADALAEAIVDLIADSAKRLRMGHAARATVVAKFSYEVVNRETLALYQELLADAVI